MNNPAASSGVSIRTAKQPTGSRQFYAASCGEYNPKRFKSFQILLQQVDGTNRALKGIEAMAMMIKEQTIYLTKSYQDQIHFFNRLFDVYA